MRRETSASRRCSAD